jgi:hypothetical protein
MLWVDKYRPMAESDLVGNQSNVKAIKNFLATWDEKHLKSSKGKGKGKSAVRLAANDYMHVLTYLHVVRTSHIIIIFGIQQPSMWACCMIVPTWHMNVK